VGECENRRCLLMDNSPKARFTCHVSSTPVSGYDTLDDAVRDTILLAEMR
jgi:hypothetical protein